jgi:hypothetical protein
LLFTAICIEAHSNHTNLIDTKPLWCGVLHDKPIIALDEAQTFIYHEDLSCMGYDVMLNAAIFGELAAFIFRVQVVIFLGLLLSLEMEAVSFPRMSVNYFTIYMTSHSPPANNKYKLLSKQTSA